MTEELIRRIKDFSSHLIAKKLLEEWIQELIYDDPEKWRPRCLGMPFNPEKTFNECTECPWLDECCLEALKR